MERVKVSRRAAEQRIARALAKNDRALRKCRRDSRDYYDVGDYYIIDVRINGIVGKHCTLEGLADELEVLRPHEVLADE